MSSISIKFDENTLRMLLLLILPYSWVTF